MRSRDSVGRGLAAHAARLHMLLEHELVRCLADHGLTRSEFDVLAALAGGEDSRRGMRPKDLSGRLLLTTGGLSNVLRRLERAGFVVRGAHADDGRGQEVVVTRAGRVAVRDADRAVQQTLRTMLAPVSYDTLTAGLRALHDALGMLDEDDPVHRPDVS